MVINLRRHLETARDLEYKLKREIDNIKRGNVGNVKSEKKFIKPCPVNDCKGFLSSAYKCGVCNIFVCSKCHEIKGDKLYSNTMLPVHTFVKQQQYMTQDSITTDVVGIDSHQFNEYVIAENNINRDTEVGPNLIRERASEKIDKINQQQISLGNEINELEYQKREARKENNGIIEMKNNIDDLQEGFTMNDELETRKVHYKESLRKVEKEYFSLMAWSVAALTTIVIGTHFIKK